MAGERVEAGRPARVRWIWSRASRGPAHTSTETTSWVGGSTSTSALFPPGKSACQDASRLPWSGDNWLRCRNEVTRNEVLDVSHKITQFSPLL